MKLDKNRSIQYQLYMEMETIEHMMHHHRQNSKMDASFESFEQHWVLKL